MDLEKLISMGTIKRFNEGDVICREGDLLSEMFIILSGRVGVFTTSTAGRPEKLLALQQGDFLGDVAVTDDLPVNVSGIAESQVIALGIAKEDFPFLIREMPDVALAVIKSLAGKVRLLEQKGKRPAAQPGAARPLAEAAGPVEKDRPENASRSPVWPEGHRTYHVYAPETDKNFYFEKEVSCPVCGGTFKTRIPRMTKLRLEKRDHDLREIYADFNPLWYTIRTCPSCFFSDSHGDFDKYHRLSDSGLKPYREKAAQLRGRFTLPPAEPLGVDRVLAGYYLALYFKSEETENPLTLAKLYMSLSWLYQDLGDEEWYERSWQKAFVYYQQAYYHSTTKLKPEHEQQLCLILGELHLRRGEKMEALQHFYRAIRKEDGVPYYNNLARERYMEVKEMLRAE